MGGSSSHHYSQCRVYVYVTVKERERERQGEGESGNCKIIFLPIEIGANTDACSLTHTHISGWAFSPLLILYVCLWVLSMCVCLFYFLCFFVSFPRFQLFLNRFKMCNKGIFMFLLASKSSAFGQAKWSSMFSKSSENLARGEVFSSLLPLYYSVILFSHL